MVRSDRRGAAGHEFHQRQAQALAARGVHVVAGGSVQAGVLRGIEIAVQGDDPAGEWRQLGKQGEQFDVVGRQVALGHLQHQRGIAGVAECPAEGGDQVMPVLAPVQRIEHRDVDHPVHDDLLVLVDVRQQRRRMLGLGGRYRLDGLGQWLRQRFQRRWRGRQRPAQVTEQPAAYRYGYQVADGFPVPQQQVVLADDQSAPPVERNRLWLWFWLRDRFGLGLGGRLGEDLEDLVLGLFPDRCDEAVGGKAQQAAVDDAALELQGLAGLDRIPFALLADRGEVLPDRRRQRQHRKIFAQHPANRAGSLLGEGDGCAMAGQDLAPVLRRIAVPRHVGNRLELPGDHAQHRALQAPRRLVRRGEGEEQAVFALFMQLPVERVDFVRALYQVDLSQRFEDWPVGLEDEVVAVFGATEVVADRALVDIRVKDEIHGIS